jgi:RNA polymerase sigma-70 factor, ECF subfamily
MSMVVRTAQESAERDRDMGDDELRSAPRALGALNEKDAGRLTEFVRDDYPRVRHIVRAFGGSKVDTDGIVAEAIARAVERLCAGQTIGDLRAWVTTVAVNLGRSEMRHHLVRRRYAPRLTTGASSDGFADGAALRLDVQAAIEKLPRRQAEVVALYYGLDLSVSEIASSLRRSEGTVKATLFKARKVLQATLGSPEGGDRHEPD